MKSRLGLALLCLAALPYAASAAEADLASVTVACDGKFGLCRYVDRETRQEILPARFERASAFSEGLAAVRIDGRFGYIDGRGEIVIAPRFDGAGDFVHGLAEVVVGRHAGIINRKGGIVVPPMFMRAYPLTGTVIVALEGTIENLQGLEDNGILPGLRDNDSHYSFGNWGLYHVAGHWIRRPGLQVFRLFASDGRGLIWASERKSYDGPFGLLASDGRWIVKPQYARVNPLRDGRAVVGNWQGHSITMLTGAVDRSGRLVVPLRPWTLSGWRNGWGTARERVTGKQALLDRDGNIIGGRVFDRVEPPEQGDVATVTIGDDWMGLDRAGHIVPNPRNGRVVEERTAPRRKPVPSPGPLDCGHGLTVIDRDGQWGIADADGRDVIAPRYRAIACFKSGVAWAAIESRRAWCALGPDGAVRETPACRTAYYPNVMVEYGPEKMDDDPFESSVLWLRADLEFAAGRRDTPPRTIRSR
jgi:WG containing repeat